MKTRRVFARLAVSFLFIFGFVQAAQASLIGYNFFLEDSNGDPVHTGMLFLDEDLLSGINTFISFDQIANAAMPGSLMITMFGATFELSDAQSSNFRARSSRTRRGRSGSVDNRSRSRRGPPLRVLPRGCDPSRPVGRSKIEYRDAALIPGLNHGCRARERVRETRYGQRSSPARFAGPAACSGSEIAACDPRHRRSRSLPSSRGRTPGIGDARRAPTHP